MFGVSLVIYSRKKKIFTFHAAIPLVEMQMVFIVLLIKED